MTPPMVAPTRTGMTKRSMQPTYAETTDCKGKAGRFCYPSMSKQLALRPKPSHPLHVLWDLEVWPLPGTDAVSPGLRERVLSGLPRFTRAGQAPAALTLSSAQFLQEIFHTEEEIALPDVPRLCAELPGVEGCVICRRHEVLASSGWPEDLQLEELIASASGALDRALTARAAGWGEPRGITLHLEVGSASLLRCEALQLLVLHEKRGFPPGVREKLTLALAAVVRSLPVME